MVNEQIVNSNSFMYIFITILIVIAAILLTLLVLVQNSKGGGLAAGFASGNQVMGAPKTADFLEKATWTIITFVKKSTMRRAKLKLRTKLNANWRHE